MATLDDYINAFKRYLPERVFQKIMQDPKRVRLEGEKRFVTVLFGDLSGFTSLTEKLEDPEKIVEIVNRYFMRMLEIVEKYGGDVDKFLGDAIMVIFGAPVAHKDDPERAVRAALEMIEAIKELGVVHTPKGDVQVNMSIGINTGEVVALNMGSDRRMEYTVMGDNVNLSARLEAVANAGEVIISDRTYRYVKDVFEFDKLQPVKVKGKEKPIQIYRVRGIKKKRTIVSKVFVNRNADLKKLKAVLEDAVRGNGRRINIYGSYGVGKTTLVNKLVEQKTGYRFIHIKGDLYLKNEPLGAFKAAVKDMYGDSIPEELGPIFSKATQSSPEILTRSFVSFFSKLLAVSPQVIFLEDLNSIDNLTISLFEQLPLDRPMLLILESETPVEAWENFEIKPLNFDATKELIVNIYGEAEPEVVDGIYKFSEGNPFLVHQVFNLLRARRFIREKDGVWKAVKKLEGFRMPESALGLAIETLDRLPEDLYQVVQFASVPGSNFSAEMISNIFGISIQKAGDLFREGVERGIFKYREGRYDFTSSLLRDAAYSTLFKKRRREFHRRVAEYLEGYYGDKRYEYSFVLGHHYEMAGEYDKAIEYILKSGEIARNLGDYALALDYYERALNLLKRVKSPEGMLEATTGLGKVYFATGEIHKARKMFRRAMIWARRIDMKRLAEILGMYSALFSMAGDLEHAIYYLKKSRRIYRKLEDREGEARNLTSMGTVFMQRGEFDRAISRFREALKIALKYDILDIAGVIYTNLGNIGERRGNLSKAKENYTLALDIWKKLKHKGWEARIFLNLGVLSGKAGNFDEANLYLENALELFEEIGDREGLAKTRMNMGIVEMSRGNLEKSLDLYRDAEAYFSEQGILDQLGIVKANIGEVWEKKGELKLAHQFYTEALELARKTGNAAFGTYLFLKIGQIHYWWGRPVDAIEHFNRAGELAEKIGINDFKLDAEQFIARVFTQVGMDREAGEILDGLNPEATGNPEIKGRILETMGIYSIHTGDYQKGIAIGERLIKGGETLNIPEMKASGLMLKISAKFSLREDISEEVGELDSIMRILEVPYIRLYVTSIMGRIYFNMGDFTSGFSVLENGIKEAEEKQILLPILPMLHTLIENYLLIGKEEEAIERIEKGVSIIERSLEGMNEMMANAFLKTHNVLNIIGDGVKVFTEKGNIPLLIDFVKKVPEQVKLEVLERIKQKDPAMYQQIEDAVKEG